MSEFCEEALAVYIGCRLQELQSIEVWQDACQKDKILLKKYLLRVAGRYCGELEYPEDWDHKHDPDLTLWVHAEATLNAKIHLVWSQRRDFGLLTEFTKMQYYMNLLSRHSQILCEEYWAKFGEVFYVKWASYGERLWLPEPLPFVEDPLWPPVPLPINNSFQQEWFHLFHKNALSVVEISPLCLIISRGNNQHIASIIDSAERNFGSLGLNVAAGIPDMEEVD